MKNYIRARRLIIKPFTRETIRENGVDLRLSDEIAKLKSIPDVLDAHGKQYAVKDFYTLEKAKSFIIYPSERILACTIEMIEMPSDLMGFVELRSTYARLGLAMPPTIIDAKFKGQLTLEILGGSFPVKVYAGDRFCHVIFAKLTSQVEEPYKGKYQMQRGVTLPKLNEEKRHTTQKFKYKG